MADMDNFSAALKKDESYASSLARSTALVLDEFYNTLRTVDVSAVTGVGMDKFFDALKEASKEYYEFYLPFLEKKIEEKSYVTCG